jgi:5-formyltetrahydrofolate cyclo-ligase
MDKKTFRKIYLDKRNFLDKEEIEFKSSIIMKKIYESELYNKADMIFTYVNFGSEIVTSEFIRKVLNDNKKVGVPLMGEEKGKMCFIEINNLESLEPNKHGILEPQYDEKKVLLCDETTLVIVPLLAFNDEKYRIGYGGGYYDRFMKKNKALTYVGVGFEWQKSEELPTEDFDCKLDIIVTDKNIYM